MSGDGDGAAAVASLHVYPVKSCRGIALDAAQLTPAGIEHDREWMIVTPEGRFVTQRELPRLALVGTALTGEHLVLSAPGLPPLALPLDAIFPAPTACEVVVWGDRCAAFDAGELAAAWLSQFLGRPLRLVRFDPKERRLSNLQWTQGVAATNRFSDGYPLLILSLASLEDLNARLASPLPMNRFRPNIVLQDLPAYAEDRIDELQAGALRLRVVKPCTRCVITTTDQERGVAQGEEPLRTLRGYRYQPELRGLCFGQNAIVIEPAPLRMGQQLALRMR